MGTTTEKLQAVLDSKEAIKTALEEQGLEPTDELATYAEMISEDLENTSDATATSGDILEGAVAYTANGRTTGTFSPTAENISYDNSGSGMDATNTQEAIDELKAQQYSHPAYTARTGVPTANQAPGFGGTFKVSQPKSDATGHITALTERTITIPNAVATQSAAGLESAEDKKKLDGIEEGAQKNTVTGIKGNAETSYRTGNVNITPANIGALASSLKGAASGVAELDSTGKVPSSQLPAFVDDVLEYSAKSSFPSTGEAGKIYVDTGTNKTYRWGGSAYAEISASLALGETSSTAYRGDRGKTAYDHSQAAHARTDATKVSDSTTNGNILVNDSEVNVYTHPAYTAKASGLYKVAVDATGHVSGTTAVAKSDITGLGIPAQDTTYSNFVKSGSGAKAGLVPAPSTTAGTTKYLREDGTWAVPPDNNTVYTHPTTSGNKHIPSGGSSGQILRWSADGTAVWGADNNTTYSAATQSAQGLMSAADKTKVDGVETNATFGIPIITATSSDGVAFVGTDSRITSLYAGLTILFVSATTTTSTTPTFNLNSLGAKNIRRKMSSGTATTVPGAATTMFYKNRPVLLTYDGTYWLAMEFTKPAASDLYGSVPIANGGTGASDVATALSNLGAVAKADIVDNLLSTATNLPLSANQGRVLKASIDELNTNLDILEQGTVHAQSGYFKNENILAYKIGNVVFVSGSFQFAAAVLANTYNAVTMFENPKLIPSDWRYIDYKDGRFAIRPSDGNVLYAPYNATSTDAIVYFSIFFILD